MLCSKSSLGTVLLATYSYWIVFTPLHNCLALWSPVVIVGNRSFIGTRIMIDVNR